MLTIKELNEKLDSLETDMNRLVDENTRLIRERESTYVELDSCIGLIAQLAVANGLAAGVVEGNTVVVELPAGQVSWTFAESEAHLFNQLTEYRNPIEEIDVQEKYRRVMNPGLIDT